MYDIRQFKPALYLLLLMGMSGFALAAQWPGVWVLSVGGVALNAWLVRTGRFTPMPRFLASIVTIIAFVYIADLVLHSTATPILIIGQFLVLLQLVKLFEQRANRDYAQLIILSLLLMVAAAINTASLLFGLMFIAYLFLSLYVCLLFHLKVESEEARKAISLPEIEPNPNTLRQDQRYLSSSMRRLTGLISFVAIVMAVNIFLFFPRGTGANLLGPLQMRPSRTLTGFSESVGFQQVARITQNHELVAHVEVWRNGQQMMGTEAIYLRGLTLDYYNGATNEMRYGRSRFEWTRTLRPGKEWEIGRDGDNQPVDEPLGNDIIRQKITLQPTGSMVLFAMAGVSNVKSSRRIAFVHSRYDGSLQVRNEQIQQPLEYEVTSSGRMNYLVPSWEEGPPDGLRRRFGGGPWGGGDATEYRRPVISNIDPKITEYARRPEVSGRAADGTPLVELRDRFLNSTGQKLLEAIQELGQRIDDRYAVITPYDEQIAANMERHLRITFTYTLDLTDRRHIADEDPMVAFLYDFKRGHCEYFAGAMTLMCQSLRIPARMVIGFRCDDFNNVGGYYRVEQNQAHAWVEVRGGTPEAPIWLTFDPTSGREDISRRAQTFWTRFRHVMDFLEHTWASNVIAYDRGSRDNLVQNLENGLTNTAINTNVQLSKIPNWLQAENWAISSQLLTGLVGLALLVMIGAIAKFAWERWRLWRRAHRIGLENLPTDERLRFARQLGFYDDLLRLLERRGMARPAHLTPMEFTDSLSFLPAEVYHSVRRLTEVFYRIRYGRQQLTPGQREKLNHSIASIETALGPQAPQKM